MKIILLSGGSGRRLWPLSNDARSKQFLRLLEAPDGGTESMIQRIVRQIHLAGLTQKASDITIATNATQIEAIISQLGEEVEAVTEPSRRDTFPAIALATTYLRKVKHCKPDETIVVMPCDPYTDSGYFETIRKMVEVVEQDKAEMALMGIRPTYASTKFGYIVPRSDAGGYYPVERFTEKPDTVRAARLIAEGALWNGGVFAFRLGYVTQIVDRYLTDESFYGFRSRYEELPKISFDYEVVEKAKNVAVVPFEGTWEDLGTWNALSKRLHRPTSGNVLLGDYVEGVNIINELEIPLFCEGIKDSIVAAGPDGIMVCSKERSEYIKDYVGKLHLRPMYEERRWGNYKVLNHELFDDGFEQLTKLITIHPGSAISYHIHRHRTEVWSITDGNGFYILEGKQHSLKRGDVVTIRPLQRHGIKAVTPLTFIEIQSGSPLVEEDIERGEWPE